MPQISECLDRFKIQNSKITRIDLQNLAQDEFAEKDFCHHAQKFKVSSRVLKQCFFSLIFDETQLTRAIGPVSTSKILNPVT